MKSKRPPVLFEWLIKLFFPDKGSYSTVGDMQEQYTYIRKTDGFVAAKWWYTKEVLRSIVPMFVQSILGGVSMIKNYLKISYRNLIRYKTYSVINILGLAVGLMCCILIYLYTVDELSYNKFFDNTENIYRMVNINFDNNGNITRKYQSGPAVLRETLPEYFNDSIERITTIMHRSGVIKKDDNMFNERVMFADQNFFETFSYQLIYGNASTVLKDENNIVITEEIAIKYFGNEFPLGKELKGIFGEVEKVFTVSGVVGELTWNSTYNFDFVVNIENQRLFYNDNPGSHRLKNLGDFSSTIIVTLKKGVDVKSLNDQFDRYVSQIFEKDLPLHRRFNKITSDQLPITFRLQNISEVRYDNSVYGGKDISTLYILIAIASIVLFIACINFMNLSIGRSSIRFKEVAVRKVIGAKRRDLFKQFWSESISISMISMMIGLILTYFVLPLFNELSGKELKFSMFLNLENVGVILFLGMLVGTFAGIYPSLILSKIDPEKIFRGRFYFGGKNIFTKSLVLIQFALSVILIVSTIVLSEQINYMLGKDLGYDKGGIVTIHVQERTPERSHAIVKSYSDKVKNYSSINEISSTSDAFGKNNISYSYIRKDEQRVLVRRYNVDDNYFDLMNLELIAGRAFSSSLITDTASVIINEACAEELGLTNPIGEEIRLFNKIPLRIIGVVKNYNFESLHEKITPVILYSRPDFGRYFVLVRVNTLNISKTIKFLNSSWNEVNPAKPFNYSFLDDDLKMLYEEDKKWQSIIGFSSMLSILIACMGVFGLTTTTISKKVKEIGIRKVLGAGIIQIVQLITKDFLLLIVAANILAWPCAYYIMKNVLQDYHCRISIGIEYFMFAGISTIGIAIMTVLYLTLKAAHKNPVESIRTE